MESGHGIDYHELVVYFLGIILVGIGLLSIILPALLPDRQTSRPPGCLYLASAVILWCALCFSQGIAWLLRGNHRKKDAAP